jgi:hypothetical protein
MDLIESAGKNFNVNFTKKEFRQTSHKLVNKCKSMGLLTDKKYKHKHQVLTEEKLDDRGTRLEHTPRRSMTYIYI